MEDTSRDLHFLHSRFEALTSGETIWLESVTEENIFCNMVGQNPLMKNIFRRIEEVARASAGVVIEGAVGVGKKCVAQSIHRLAWRGRGKMVSVRCGVLESGQLDSENIKRYEEEFAGVSLFVERIENLSKRAQEKLLEILENKSFDEWRLMASSCHALDEKIESGKFDKRLSQYFSDRIRVPTLGDRRGDVPLLLAHFFCRYSDGEKGCLAVAKPVLKRLQSYSWPGNVRELENLVEQWAALKCNEVIRSSDLPEKFFQEPDKICLTEEGIDLKEVLSEIEDSLIIQALRMTGDNKNKASQLLRMNRTTLIEKMKKKGLLKSS